MKVPAFIVGNEIGDDLPRPSISVDGSVNRADITYDHHQSGEIVNLSAIPENVPVPGTIATTMIDADSVISAAVVILRFSGEEGPVRTAWPVLHEACCYCDILGPSGRFPESEQAGLGLYCWLKEKGFALGEVLAFSEGGIRPDNAGGHPSPRLSPGTRAFVFRSLTLAIVERLRAGSLPCDYSYLERLGAMEAEARRLEFVEKGPVTLLRMPPGTMYIDPIAIYRVVRTDLLLQTFTHQDGAFKYTLGVHPGAYGRVTLTPAYPELCAKEPGWGGRPNAGGSPVQGGSRLTTEEVVGVLRSLSHSPPTAR